MRTQCLNSGNFWSINHYLRYVGVSHRKLMKHKVSMNQSFQLWIIDLLPTYHSQNRAVQNGLARIGHAPYLNIYERSRECLHSRRKLTHSHTHIVDQSSVHCN